MSGIEHWSELDHAIVVRATINSEQRTLLGLWSWRYGVVECYTASDWVYGYAAQFAFDLDNDLRHCDHRRPNGSLFCGDPLPESAWDLVEFGEGELVSALGDEWEGLDLYARPGE